MKHVAIIGYGAIARYVMTAIAERDGLSLCGIIARAGRLEGAQACAPDTVAIAGMWPSCHSVRTSCSTAPDTQACASTAPAS